MIRLFIGLLITIAYTYWEYLMITLYDSLILQLLPIILLGLGMSYLWHVGFMAGLEQDALKGSDDGK